MKSKVERPKYTYLPPSWCSDICENSMNEVCIERCTPKRNCSGFRLKQGLNIDDLPPFPLNEWLADDMTNNERKICGAIYISRLTDHIQGVRREPPPIRPYTYLFQNGRISEDIPIADLGSSEAEVNTVNQNQEEHESEAKEPGEENRETATAE